MLIVSLNAVAGSWVSATNPLRFVLPCSKVDFDRKGLAV